MIGKIDTEAIKGGVDLRDLAGGRVELRPETSGGREQSGPCPKCGGDDRLHVTADWFMCRQCHPKRGDALEYVQWLGLAADFRAACEYLGGPALIPSPGPAGPTVKRTPAAKSKAASWQDAAWQSDARAILTQAQAALIGPEGAEGRDYLTAWGLTPATWGAWGLGYTPAAWDRPLAEHLLRQGVDPKTWPNVGYGVAKNRAGDLYATRAAIVIPWQRDKITALKYRFLTVPDGGLRYSSKGGGQCLAFGLGLAGEHFSTLWLLEGELNALALWQALHDGRRVNFDVVSFGAESGALTPTVTAWAKRYQQVIVWADDPGKAAAATAAIPGAFGLRSPLHDGHKLDANDLLRLGKLADFARMANDRFDADPAYVARIRADFDALGDP